MPEDQLPTSPAPTVEVCYRHPGEQTRVHCTRCERPICTDCMIPAPVGFQCPECVEEARREFKQGPGRALRGGMSATKFLLIAIGLVYAVEVAVGGPGSLFEGPSVQSLIDLGALQPFLVANGQFWRLFTAMFLHGGLLHIAFNAYALYLFGAQVESTLGRTRFVIVYFVSGFIASAASYAFGPVEAVAVGASAAIFGVLGAFVAYNYRRRNLAVAAANLRWALTLILLNTLLIFAFRGIDWRAHVGGLIAGFAAGWIAEGSGETKAQRTGIQVAGLIALIALGVGLVMWRTTAIRDLPFFNEGVAFFGG